jgi:hypothetical protein
MQIATHSTLAMDDPNGPFAGGIVDEVITFETQEVSAVETTVPETTVSDSKADTALSAPDQDTSVKPLALELSVDQSKSTVPIIAPQQPTRQTLELAPVDTRMIGDSLELSSKPRRIKPQDELRIFDGKIDPSSIQSFDAKAAGMTYCSWITRNNLQRLAKLPDTDILWSFDHTKILIWDALTLINKWLKADIFKEVYLNDGSIERYMHRLHRHTNATLFDIFIWHTEQTQDFFAGHRVTGFLWSDDQVYILDPVMLPHQDPVTVEYYFDTYGKDQDRIFIVKHGYVPDGYTYIPYDILTVGRFSELQSAIDRGDIIVSTLDDRTEVRFGIDVRFASDYTMMDIEADTMMTVYGDRDPSTLYLQSPNKWDWLIWRQFWSYQNQISRNQAVRFALFVDGDDRPFTPLVDIAYGDQTTLSPNQFLCTSVQDVPSQSYITHKGWAIIYTCDHADVSLLDGIATWIEKESDGTAPFHDQSYDGSAFIWQDNSPDNHIVRAGDTVSYRMYVAGSEHIDQDLSVYMMLQSDRLEHLEYIQLPRNCVYVSTTMQQVQCILTVDEIKNSTTLPFHIKINADAPNDLQFRLVTKMMYGNHEVYRDIGSFITVTNFFNQAWIHKMHNLIDASTAQLQALGAFLRPGIQPF